MSFGNTPLFKWAKNYNKSFLRFDAIAGITVGAIAIPEVIAYSSLAGLSPETGLYATIAALLVYFLLGTSNQLSVGPTSALSILVGSSLATLTITNSGNIGALAVIVALITGTFALIAWVLKMGFIVKFISRTVLNGFSAGAGFFIIGSQLAHIFGIPINSANIAVAASFGFNFFYNLFFLTTHLNQTHILTLVIGIISIIYLFVGEKIFPKIPHSLVLMVVSMAIFTLSGTFFNIGELGISTIASMPWGLPSLIVPDLTAFSNIPIVDLSKLLVLGIVCFILSYVEGMGAAQTFALKNNNKIDVREELLALGVSNIFSGLVQGLPVGGSLSRTAINDESKSKSPLSSLFASIILILTLLFFAEFFSNIPMVVLAAILVFVVSKLIKISEFKRYYQLNRREFFYALATFLGVLIFGMFEGIVIGVIISFLDIIYRLYKPRIVELGHVKGTYLYANEHCHPENETIPNVLIIRVDGPQLFVNSENIRDTILRRANRYKDIKLVILDMENTEYIDIAGAERLEELHDKLKEIGIEFRLAQLTGPVRKILRKLGFAEDLGLHDIDFITVDNVIKQWKSRNNIDSSDSNNGVNNISNNTSTHGNTNNICDFSDDNYLNKK
ncbi:MAG: SulP family inorganic anion transporter [Methanobacteriaceae archaeon]